jgi:hypothetical protein
LKLHRGGKKNVTKFHGWTSSFCLDEVWESLRINEQAIGTGPLVSTCFVVAFAVEQPQGFSVAAQFDACAGRLRRNSRTTTVAAAPRPAIHSTLSNPRFASAEPTTAPARSGHSAGRVQQARQTAARPSNFVVVFKASLAISIHLERR